MAVSFCSIKVNLRELKCDGNVFLILNHLGVMTFPRGVELFLKKIFIAHDKTRSLNGARNKS